MKPLNCIIVLAALSVAVISPLFAEESGAPTVDATDIAVQSTSATSSSTSSHWFDGPITGGSTVAAVTPDDSTQVSQEKAESDISLPAVSSSSPMSGASPAASATNAAILPVPPAKELPPVVSLTDSSASSSSSDGVQSTGYSNKDSSLESQSSSSMQKPASPKVLAYNHNSTQESYSSPSYDSAGSDQAQIQRLQQQVQNMVAMNMPQQISDLQQQIQVLSGKLAEATHQVQVLQQQQAEFYKDTDSRISALQDNSKTLATANSLVKSDPALKVDHSELELYQIASRLLAEKKYDDASKAYLSYLDKYPNGKYASNSYYWLGELSLVKKDYKNALESFNKVVTDFSSSSKVADAMYKIGLINLNQSDAVLATKMFNQVKNSYPGTTAAQLSNIKLQQLALESDK